MSLAGSDNVGLWHNGFALVLWTPKLKREERLEVSDEQSNSEAKASVQAVQF